MRLHQPIVRLPVDSIFCSVGMIFSRLMNKSTNTSTSITFTIIISFDYQYFSSKKLKQNFQQNYLIFSLIGIL